MHKVVIIDDEPMLCRGMAEKMDWKQWDCKVVATAMNGIEGREIIDTFHPDIVISDIQMPGLSGLELAKYIRNHYPDTITILLTGYNHFDYARSALRENVFDYLLKPIDKQELNQTMINAIQEISKNHKYLEEAQVIKRKWSDCSPLAETGILMKLLLCDRHQVEQLKKNMTDLEFNMDKGQVIVFRYEDDQPQLDGQIHKLVQNILMSTFEDNKCNICFAEVEGKEVIVARYSSHVTRRVAEQRILEATRNALFKIKSNLGKKCYAGIGDSFGSIEELSVSYQTALQRLKYHAFWKLQDVDHHFHSIHEPIYIELDLFEAVKKGEEVEALKAFDDLADQWRLSRNIETVRRMSLEILIQLLTISKTSGLQNTNVEIKNINDYLFFDDLVRDMRTLIHTVCQSIHTNKHSFKGNLIDRIVQYMDENFTNSLLGLPLLAHHFHLSESHLSRLFKKEKGINFHDYLTLIRIEKAKRIFHDYYWMSNHEIALQVGFSDGKYFGQVFKKHCGVTPTEFRGKRQSCDAKSNSPFENAN